MLLLLSLLLLLLLLAADVSPMLMVACLLMTSGDRGLSFSITRVLRSCVHDNTNAVLLRFNVSSDATCTSALRI